MSGPSRETVQLVGARGIGLVADRYGDVGDPPALLLHGGGQTRAAWGQTSQALAAAGWWVTALDLRGHGDSEWPPDADYDIASIADDVATVARGLGRRPAVVGASLGGLAALVAQGRASEQLYAALILVDVAPRIELAGVQRVVGFMTAHAEGFGSLEEAARAISAYNPHRPATDDLSGLEKVLRRSPEGRWRWHWDPRFLESAARGKLQQALADPDRLVAEVSDQLHAAARAVEVPTLLVRGAESDMVSDEGVEGLRDAIPHSSFVDVRGAGHMVAGDRNDAFTAVVLEFLDTLNSGARTVDRLRGGAEPSP